MNERDGEGAGVRRHTPGDGPAFDPRVLASTLDRLRSRPIPPTEKGFAALGPVSARELVEQKVRLWDLTFPVMVLREEALASNVATMAEWCRSHGVLLAPHGKTSMSPQITALQLEAGAWGVTAATIGQVRTFTEFGVRRILLANQLTDPAGIAWLAQALHDLPDLTVVGYVDSVAGVRLLDDVLRSAGARRRLSVLLELGVPGRRTGVRTTTEALEVARCVQAAETLVLAGVSTFEGVLGHDRDEATKAEVARLCRRVRELGLDLARRGLIDGPPLLSGGGSTYFDVVAEALDGPEPATVLLRSGGYVTHDDGLYATRSTPLPSRLRAALDVWAYVLSRPEPGRVLAGAGRRDVPFDVALPVVRSAVARSGVAREAGAARVTALNDQHMFLDVPPGSDLAVGDALCLGIAHPCTAFDKWRVVPVVAADGSVTDVAYTFF